MQQQGSQFKPNAGGCVLQQPLVDCHHISPGLQLSAIPNIGSPAGSHLLLLQRYGPPPSYPNLKIPGLNAPIPPGASFGYHAGGWGKPPVDSAGNALYGDVFGLAQDEGESDAELDKTAR